MESDRKNDSIRTAIRKKFGSGNESYSLKTLDQILPPKYLAYIVKDGEIIAAKNISEQVISDAIKLDQEMKENYKKKKKNKSRTKLEIIQEEYFSEADGYSINGRMITTDYVVESVLDYYIKQSCLISNHQITSLCTTLCLRYVPSYEIMYRNHILNQIDVSTTVRHCKITRSPNN